MSLAGDAEGDVEGARAVPNPGPNEGPSPNEGTRIVDAAAAIAPPT